MLYVIVAINENVVDVNDAEVVEILAKNFVNEVLKRFENVAQIEEHHYVLVQVVSSDENDFFLIVFANSNLIEDRDDVELDIDLDRA